MNELARSLDVQWDRPVVSFDTETDGLDPMTGARPFMWAMAEVADDDNGTICITTARPHERSFRRIREVLADPSIAKVAHNAKFDLKMAKAAGVEVAGVVHDTMLMAACVNEYEPSFKMEELARRKLGEPCRMQRLVKVWKEANSQRIRAKMGRELLYCDMPDPLVRDYISEDVQLCLKLWYYYCPAVKQLHADHYAWELALVRVLAVAEMRGVQVDSSYISAMRRDLGRALEIERDRAREMTDNLAFNPQSTLHVQKALATLGAKLTVFTPAGNPKTDAETLEAIEHPLARSVVAYRQDSKLLGTYLNNFMTPDSRVRPSFWQGASSADRGIRTGRLSCSDPNMQNIPARRAHTIRRCFVPSPGMELWFLDYKQIEMLLFIHYAKADRLRTAVVAGEDLHAFTAKLALGISDEDWAALKAAKGPVAINILGQVVEFAKAFEAIRFMGKQMNFAVLYGAGVERLMNTLNKYGPRRPDGELVHQFAFTETKAIFVDYLRALPEVADARRSSESLLARSGYLTDAYGHRYHVPRDLAYKALNALIQGTAAGVMKRAMVKMHSHLQDYNRGRAVLVDNLGANRGAPPGIVLTIHDEIIVECGFDESCSVIPGLMKVMACSDFDMHVGAEAKWTNESWAHTMKPQEHPNFKRFAKHWSDVGVT